jgi:hypothetical protein
VVGGGSSLGKNKSCGGCFESNEVMVAPTRSKGEDREAPCMCVLGKRRQRRGASGVAVGHGSKNGVADSVILGGKKEGGCGPDGATQRKGGGADRRAVVAHSALAVARVDGRCSDRGCERLAGGAPAQSQPVDSI